MTIPVGQMKAKKEVCCSICGCSYERSFKTYIYENTPESIATAKAELTKKHGKTYTCRICASIQKAVK